MSKDGLLIYVPLLVTLLLVICYSSLSSFKVAKGTFSSLDSYCVPCSEKVAGHNCTSTDAPVLGGVDVVNYFVAYKLADGSYNESETGIAGSSEFSSIYGGYTFYFSSQSNLNLFEESPSTYVPQWGGFCSWGIATEVCPYYAWSASCMGPYGDWSHWTIYNDKIYFFWYDEAKIRFKEDPETYVADGDLRWSGLYGGDYTFNTNCFVD